MSAQLGLGAILTFASRGAEATMGRAASAFSNLQNSAKKAVSGVAQVGMATGAAGIALAPLALGLGVAANQAINFDHQMQAVKAVAQGGDFGALEAEAKRLGATTKFTATEAAEGMELMARAGFTSKEVLAGVGGVLQAAAADGMGLAEATDVVTQTLRGMGLTAGDTGRVADVLAMTSAKTNSSISSLGHSFTYAAAQSRTMGLNLEQTAAALGKISDAGLKGSLAGTSMTNMLVQLAKPSKEAKALMGQFGISLSKIFATPAKEGGPMVALIEQFGSKIERIRDPVMRARVATELFGVRGQKAFSALLAGGANAKDAAGKLRGLTEQLDAANGAAKTMADIRLDSFSGQATILASAAEGLALEVFLPMVRAMKPFVTAMSTGIGQVTLAIQQLRAGDAQAGAGIPKTLFAIAKGVSSAITIIVDTIAWGATAWGEFRASAGSAIGGDLLANIVKVGTLLAFAGAALSPLLIGLAGVGFVVTSVIIPVVSGLASVFMGVAGIIFGPVGAALLGVFALFSLLQTEGESYGQTAMRLWAAIRDGALAVWTNGIQPFITGVYTAFMPVLETLGVAWLSIKDSIMFAWTELFGFFTAGASTTETDWLAVGQKIGAVLGAVIGTIAQLFSMVVRVVALVGVTLVQFGTMIFEYIAMPFKMVWNLVKQVGTGVLEILSGDVINGFKRMGLAVLDFLLEPLRTVLSTFVQISDMAHMPVPQGVRDFVDKELNRPVLFDEKPVSPATEALAQQKQVGAEVNVQVMGPPMPDIKVNAKIQVDGRDLAISLGKQQTEYQERAGFKTEQWQRRAVVEHGALTVQR